MTLAIKSPILNGPATLGELWSANPDLREVTVPAGRWPIAIEIPLETESVLGGRPDFEPDPEQHAVPTEGYIGVPLDLPGDTGAEIDTALRPYPTLRDAFGIKPTYDDSPRAGPNDAVIRGMGTVRDAVAVGVEAPRQISMAELWRRKRALASIVEVDETKPTYPSPSLTGFALPEIAGGRCPHPLLLWWALLLGVSILARYEPATWVKAIDPDRSELAVSLEKVMAMGQDRVPKRILQALAGQFG